MAEFHSNITFVDHPSATCDAMHRMRCLCIHQEKEIELLDFASKHCCFCNSPECNPSIPEGDCGQHDYEW